MDNSSPGEGRPLALLLVEDNQGDARLVKEAFRETPFADLLHVVSDGEEALDYVYQRGEHTDARKPDLILLDWHLPDISGEKVLAELKGDQTLKHIPVVVLTASQVEREIMNSYNTHANACMIKPSDPDELIDAIRVFEEFWLTVARLPNPVDEESENGTR